MVIGDEIVTQTATDSRR